MESQEMTSRRLREANSCVHRERRLTEATGHWMLGRPGSSTAQDRVAKRLTIWRALVAVSLTWTKKKNR